MEELESQVILSRTIR